MLQLLMPYYCLFLFLQFILIFEIFLVVQLDATGRPDESLVMEFVGPLKPNSETNLECGQLLSFLLQKGQLKANVCFQPFHSATLEVPVFSKVIVYVHISTLSG